MVNILKEGIVMADNQIKLALDMILNKPASDITKKLIEDLFAGYHDRANNVYKDPPFKPNTIFTLTPEMYKYVKIPTKTTLGLLLMNRYCLERTGCLEYMDYWNTPLTSSGLKKLNTAVNLLFIDKKIDADQKADYIDSRDRLGFWCVAFLGTSVTAGLIRPMHDVEKRKDELFEAKKEELKSDNPVTRLMASNSIESELVKMAKKNLKDDSGYDMYASGVNNMDNNYKNINIMRGAVYNETTGNFDIGKNSLMNGLTKEDIPAQANLVVAGAYPSAIGTAEAGYMAKIVLAVLQSVEVDSDVNSDCGTKSTIPVTIRPANKQHLIYRNMIIDGKRVYTTLNNIDQYVGKTVRMFSPQCCLNEKICCKCAGKVFHNLGITKAGLMTTEITQALLNLKLKSKHNLSQKAGVLSKEQVFLKDVGNNATIDKEKGVIITNKRLKLYVPKLMESQSTFEVEASHVMCMGTIPIRFYDDNDKEIMTTMLTIPAIVSFNVYSEPQETPDAFIITYEPGSIVTNIALRQSVANVEYFINQVYLYNKQPVLPYNMMTEMMLQCLDMNGINLNGPSITYEFLARQLCFDQSGDKTFAYVYGRDQNVDQHSYVKMWFREAVQRSGVLNGILFQDISTSLNKGLAATLNGKQSSPSPFEKIIRA